MSVTTADEILRSMAVLREMLTDRGCTPVHALDLTDEQVAQMVHSAAAGYVVIDVSERLKVVYFLTPKTRLQDVRSLLKDEESAAVGDAEACTYILIVRDKPNSADQKRLLELGQQQQARSIEFQVFNIKELQINISRHVLVPKHELVSDPAAIDALVGQYQLKSKTQFPHILRSDPMARYLDARPGQLVRITRVSPSSGMHVVYRCCV